MPTRTRRRSPLKHLALPALLVALTAWFAWQAGRGVYGTNSHREFRETVAALSAEHARLVAEREALEARVARLRPEALDADLLDERARAKLNLVRIEELVVFAPAGEARPR